MIKFIGKVVIGFFVVCTLFVGCVSVANLGIS
ncbi:hypothetical protein [Salmonella phage PKM.Hi.22.6]|nr:hypothetical protein [Salmonella phage PKM.Hi.22.6]